VIFEPDAIFTRILVQRLAKDNSDNWEVFLDEQDKGRIALSDSGSGLKTVLLVLLLLLVVPHLEGKPLSSYVFAFEELENNTHPALQRRLLLFLHRLAVASDLTFFLTTHSTVAIDVFSRDADSQILYVTHDRRESKVQNVQAYEQNRKILDDLDLRASVVLHK
jgi:AAA15 family ATPase/GTPase